MKHSVITCKNNIAFIPTLLYVLEKKVSILHLSHLSKLFSHVIISRTSCTDLLLGVGKRVEVIMHVCSIFGGLSHDSEPTPSTLIILARHIFLRYLVTYLLCISPPHQEVVGFITNNLNYFLHIVPYEISFAFPHTYSILRLIIKLVNISLLNAKLNHIRISFLIIVHRQTKYLQIDRVS